MKRVAIALSFLLLITSCAANGGLSSQAPDSELVSCSTIQQVTENFFDPMLDLSLDCLDGSESIKLSMIKGPAVVNVWASWCTSCEDELPFLKEFSKINGEKVQFIGIDVEEKSATVGANFAKKNNMSWPHLFDPDGRTSELFGMGIPVTWFIDRNGKVTFKKIGTIKSLSELKGLVDQYLGVKI